MISDMVSHGPAGQKWLHYGEYIKTHFGIETKASNINDTWYERPVTTKFEGDSYLYYKDRSQYKSYGTPSCNYITPKEIYIISIKVIGRKRIDFEVRTGDELDYNELKSIWHTIRMRSWITLQTDKESASHKESNWSWNDILNRIPKIEANNVYMSPEMKKRLLQLCHPDKNDVSKKEICHEITQWLLSLKL